MSEARSAAQLLEAITKRVAQPASAEASDARWSYREAAAVLHCFDPAKLQPVDGTLAVANPMALLFQDSVPAAGGRAAGLRALKPEIRSEALQRLGGQRLRAALVANPERVMTDVQKLLEAWLEGRAPALADQSTEELSQTLQIVLWLGKVFPGLPTESEVREHLNRRAVVRPFEHLVSQDFVGRDAEMEKLRDYVGVLPPKSFTSATVRFFRSWMKMQSVLLLHGPGGIGKSALVGRFLQEHSQVPPELRFPFAYLPFDNPLLQVREPNTLLVEAASQLSLQYPDRPEAHERFRKELEIYRSARASLGGHVTGSGSRRGKLDEVSRLDHSLFESFGDLLHELAGPERPALLVLDTFEEVQYRPKQELTGFSRMLGVLQERFPNLRVVASGRTPADDLKLNGERPRPIPLEPLDVKSAEKLLQLQGVSDPELARSLAQQLGGNPLTLRLAARAVTSHPELAGKGLEGVQTRRYLLFSVPQELIQGQLYRRVLDHIHDDEVRKLAHPGMVLRRVTPEAIQQVLSGPCGVPVPDEKAARKLFKELRKEHALVRLEDTSTLQYRPEIRKPMLRLLERERPAQVREIHQAAVWFWSQQEGAAARAEELYHRLVLDPEDWQLESRWLPEAGPSLISSRDELPPQAQAWLASHMSLKLDPKVEQAASQTNWERRVGRQALDVLRYQDVESALGLLGERADRLPGSGLYPLEARVYLLAERPRQALEILDQGLSNMPLDCSPGRLAEMLWLHAQAAAELGLFGVATADLARAAEVARDIADPLCRVQILTQRLILLERSQEAAAEDLAPRLRDNLAHLLTQLGEEQMDRERVLVRAAASHLTPEHWPSIRRVVEAVGASDYDEGAHREAFDTSKEPSRVAGAVLDALRSQSLSLDAANLAGIEEYRETWEKEFSPEAVA